MNEADKSRRNVAASVRARLLNKARAERLDFNLLLTRYALERFLYRLSISEHHGQFLLKGALLFDIRFDAPHRPTHDADLLGFGPTEIPPLEDLFRRISQIASEDGIVFQADSVKAAQVRKEANYAGVRVTMIGLLDGARCPVQIDIGFGDAVTPGPDNVQYPVILDDMPQPQLRVYPRDAVAAEKLEVPTSTAQCWPQPSAPRSSAGVRPSCPARRWASPMSSVWTNRRQSSGRRSCARTPWSRCR